MSESGDSTACSTTARDLDERSVCTMPPKLTESQNLPCLDTFAPRARTLAQGRTQARAMHSGLCDAAAERADACICSPCISQNDVRQMRCTNVFRCSCIESVHLFQTNKRGELVV
eukprot:8710659-Pyramimonas_sp.AAC.1